MYKTPFLNSLVLSCLEDVSAARKEFRNRESVSTLGSNMSTECSIELVATKVPANGGLRHTGTSVPNTPVEERFRGVEIARTEEEGGLLEAPELAPSTKPRHDCCEGLASTTE
jgi:hypothetical protein